MADVGKDPIPEIEKSINLQKYKNVEIFGQAPENLITFCKLKICIVILLLYPQN